MSRTCEPVAPAAGIGSVRALTGVALGCLALSALRRYLYPDLPFTGTPDGARIFALVAGLLGAAGVLLLVYCEGLRVYLAGGDDATARARSRDLARRGIVLIVAEIAIVRPLAWFTIDYGAYLGVLEVLWALGASLLILAVLVHLSWRDIVIFAVLVIALHNLLDGRMMPGAEGFGTAPGALGKLWILLHQSGDIFRVVGTTGTQVAVALPILPFAGVMAAGFASGRLFSLERARRAELSRRAGWCLLATFVVLRATSIYGDQREWSPQPGAGAALVSFFELTPYPPSLQLTLLTFGLAHLLFAAFERRTIRLAWLERYGRWPAIGYVVQVLIVHAIAGAVTLTAGRDPSYLFVTSPFTERPPAGEGAGAGVILASWIASVAVVCVALEVIGRLQNRVSGRRG